MTIKITNMVKRPDLDIDCEVEHPVYGWVPFTASPFDIVSHGPAIYEAANNHLGEGGKMGDVIESPAEFEKSPNHRLADLEAENEALKVALAAVGITVGTKP